MPLLEASEGHWRTTNGHLQLDQNRPANQLALTLAIMAASAVDIASKRQLDALLRSTRVVVADCKSPRTAYEYAEHVSLEVTEGFAILDETVVSIR